MAKVGFDEYLDPGISTRCHSADGVARTTEVSLGKITALNINAVAATPIFAIALPPGAKGLVVTKVVRYADTIAATTASISFGQTATPTDWAATAVNANAAAAKAQIISATAALQPFYTAATNFVANVTIAQGAAATCDLEAFGYYV